MPRQRFIYREGRGLVEVPTDYRPRPRRAPAIRTDAMDPIVSQADGLTYDSKSAYYASVKAQGYEIVGNDYNGFDTSKPKLPPIEEDLKRTAEQMGIDL